MKPGLILFLICFALLLAGCGPGTGASGRGLGHFVSGNYPAAVAAYEEPFLSGDKQDLLAMLEFGSALHANSEYSRSSSILEQADEQARILSYVSLSEETLALLTTDRVKDYRAAEYERFVILYLLAINSLMAGEPEKALVELRRITEFAQEPSIIKHAWMAQPLARYLSGVCYLRFGEFDNAVREFQAAVDLDPSNGEYRTCLALATDLRARDPLEQETGWLIVFAETGLAPFKVRHNPVVAIPRFVRARSRYSGAMVSTRASGSELAYAGTLDIEALACRWLHERAGAYLAREVGHAVAREVLADQVGKVFKSKEAREITRVVMMLARQPDTRSWRTIPQQISVYAARLPDHEGELAYAVRSSYGGERADKVHFAVKKARITTVLLRALN